MNDDVGTGAPTLRPRGGEVTIDRVSHRFTGPDGRPVQALDDVDLRLDAGSFNCVVGPSGCGKSTLLRIVAGLIPPSDGSVRVDGETVDGPAHDRGVVFQQPALYPWLNVEDNVALGLRLRGVGRRERLARARDRLHLVGLDDVATFAPYELSGGMQQRVQLARVMANDPAIILMDEPFGALDAITRERLQDELRSIWARDSKTILFITHSVDEAVHLGTRVLVMSSRPGRVVLDVPIAAEWTGPEARHDPRFADLVQRVGTALDDHHGRSPTV